MFEPLAYKNCPGLAQWHLNFSRVKAQRMPMQGFSEEGTPQMAGTCL